MTAANPGRPGRLAAAFPVLFPAAPEAEPDLLVIGPCDRTIEPEPEIEAGI